MTIHRHLTAGTLALALGLTACTTDTTDTASQSTTVESAQSIASPDTADVEFAQGMIPHHVQAVAMADLAIERSTNPEVLDLARRIQAAQDPEIEQMRGWLTTWGHDEHDGETDHDANHDEMHGMMSDDDLSSLGGLTGPAFDTAFAEMMIRHHEGAIAMAEVVLTDGTDPEVRALAEAVITAQQAEIDELLSLQTAPPSDSDGRSDD